MRGSRRLFRILLLLCGYIAASAVIGVFVAEAALHPARRALTSQGESLLRSVADNNVAFEAVSIKANDGIQLRAWSLHPQNRAANAVILLHGMGDNRSGMAGYAELLLKHGYSVLLPDARAHGVSGGELATYGLLERDDIRRWFEWLELNQSPPCIFGLGESMGAAQLLQSLENRTRLLCSCRRIFFLYFSRNRLRPGGPAFPNRAVAGPLDSVARRRGRVPVFTMEVRIGNRENISQRRRRQIASAHLSHSRRARQQYPTAPFAKDSSSEQERHIVGGTHSESLRRNKRRASRIRGLADLMVRTPFLSAPKSNFGAL